LKYGSPSYAGDVCAQFLITLAVNACLGKCKDAGFDTRIGISLAHLIKASRRGVEILEI
jgi:hypothetical protein